MALSIYDTQHKNTLYQVTLCIEYIMLSVSFIVMLSVVVVIKLSAAFYL
jgi:hypothetical protein